MKLPPKNLIKVKARLLWAKARMASLEYVHLGMMFFLGFGLVGACLRFWGWVFSIPAFGG